MLAEPDKNLLRGSKGRKAGQLAVKVAVGIAATISLVITLLIVLTLFLRAGQFIWNLASPSEAVLDETGKPLGLDLLWGEQWSPRNVRFDIKTLLLGSLIVTVVAMLVATPLGFGAAIYLSEYARPRVRRILKPILEILAGIPSIVIAFFALRFISPNVVQNVFTDAPSQNLLVAGLGVGLLTIPLVASVSEDALRAVPQALRQASAGMGARRMRTTLSVVSPAAISGLVAALIIGVSRAIGETMVVFLAAGGGGNSANFTASPLDKGATMTAAMASQASGTDGQITQVGVGSLYFVGAALFLITLILNLIADRFVRRVREKY